MSKKDLTKDCLLAKDQSNSTPQASLQCSNSGVSLSGDMSEMVDKPKYHKPALSLRGLAELIIRRGIQDVSVGELEQRLRFVNYYRLRGYTYPYQDNAQEDAHFKPGTKWQDIWDDYWFDQDLRMLMFDGISRYEIAFRSVVALNLCEQYGAQWYENEDLFESVEFCKNYLTHTNPSEKQKKKYEKYKERYKTHLKELDDLWKRSQEEFKEHYLNHYNNSQRPPAWMIFETATMGIVSKFFENVKNGCDAKKEVLKQFGFKRAQSDVFTSWNHHLNYVRNICAHHARLFSRKFTITPTFCKDSPEIWVSEKPNKHRIYASICILVHLLSICSPEYPFKMKIRELLLRTSEKQREMMGVPEDWMEQALFMEEEMLQLNVNPGIENEVER